MVTNTDVANFISPNQRWYSHLNFLIVMYLLISPSSSNCIHHQGIILTEDRPTSNKISVPSGTYNLLDPWMLLF